MSTERLAKQMPLVWPKNRLFSTLFRTIGFGEAMRGLWRYCHRTLTRSLAFASADRAHHGLPICKGFPQNTTPSWRRIFPNILARRLTNHLYGALHHPQRSPRLFAKAPDTSFFSSFLPIAGQDRPCRNLLSALRLVTKGLDSVYRKSFPSLAMCRSDSFGRPRVRRHAKRHARLERGAIDLGVGV